MDAAEDSDESAEIEEIISFIRISQDGVVLASQEIPFWKHENYG